MLCVLLLLGFFHSCDLLFYLLLCAVHRCVYALAETLSLQNSKQRVARSWIAAELASLKFLASVAAEKFAPCE